MAYRARVAVLAAVAAGSLLPAPGAAAAECVKVVVDYGTFADSPAGPRTACVDVPYGGTAADALAGRARYKGNFLCAIDGYPRSGCGDEPPSPYWSIWYWSGGRWVYSQEGVATLEVADRDRDGHPDPFGFRYHEVDGRLPPRSDPSYPKPTPRATTAAPTTRAPRPRATTSAPAAPGHRPTAATGGPTDGPAPGLPGGEPVTGAPGHPTTRPPSPGATTTATPSATPSAAETAEARAAGPDDPPVPGDGGVPAGTVAGGALALALLGAAAYRFRKPAA